MREITATLPYRPAWEIKVLAWYIRYRRTCHHAHLAAFAFLGLFARTAFAGTGGAILISLLLMLAGSAAIIAVE